MRLPQGRRSLGLVAALGLLAAVSSAHAQPAPSDQKPTLNSDGSIQVPSFTLPFSSLASPEAKAAFNRRITAPPPFFGVHGSIADIRKAMDADTQPLIDKQYARYAVEMRTENIAGVYTQVFTPKAGILPKNRNRVLINLHGGGFVVQARSQSQVESIPISAVGRIKVISVDYRQGPENHFPAASEDVAAVYRELLKTHRPSEIGIYGCSAGGQLTGEAMAWFQKVGLPNPAAIGIFCASTRHFGEGDSAYVSSRLGGVLPPPPPPGAAESVGALSGYFKGADQNDPLVTPSASPAVLARFPPTLLITGTRAGDMSAATRSHIELVKAGVDARLFLWDGLDHGFFGNPDLPESREMYDITVHFFDEQMDRAAARDAHHSAAR